MFDNIPEFEAPTVAYEEYQLRDLPDLERFIDEEISLNGLDLD